MQPARAGFRAARLASQLAGPSDKSSQHLQHPWSVAALWTSLCTTQPHCIPSNAGFSSLQGGSSGSGSGDADVAASAVAASPHAAAAFTDSSASAAAAAAASDAAAMLPPPPPPWPLLDGGCAALDAVHALTGLPWWASIPLATLTVKTALLPLSLRQARIVRSNMAIWRESYELARQREVKEALAVKQRAETAGGVTAAASTIAAAGPLGTITTTSTTTSSSSSSSSTAVDHPLAAARESIEQLQRWQRRVALYSRLRIKCGVPHPGWFLVNNLAQWPVLVYLGLCVRSMAQRQPPWPGFDCGGALWFPDLTLPAVTSAAAAAAAAAAASSTGGGSLAAAGDGVAAVGSESGAAAAAAAADAAAGVTVGGWLLPMGFEGLGLPLLVTGTMLTSIRLGFKATGAASRHPSVSGTFLQPLLRYAPAALYTLTLASLVIKLQLPQAALLHWAASAGFTLSLQLALRRPGVRAALGYGPPPSIAAAGAAAGVTAGAGKGLAGGLGAALDADLAARVAAAGSADVLVALAARESAAHRYGAAAHCLARAVEMEPGNAGAHYAAAQVAALTGDWAAAEAAYARCVSTAEAGGPNSEYAPFVGQALFCLGTARARQGRASEALEAYAAAAAGYNQPHAIAQARGSALLVLGRVSEAAAAVDAGLAAEKAKAVGGSGSGVAGAFVDMTPVLLELRGRIKERQREEGEVAKEEQEKPDL